MPLPILDSDLLDDLEKGSVQATTTVFNEPTILLIARSADEAPLWWSPLRDQYLRNFFPTEPYLSGAVYSVCARNASYNIEFKGSPEGVQRANRLIHTANMFKGWYDFSLKLSLDYTTQDNFGFFEVIRPAKIRTDLGETLAVKMFNDQGDIVWGAKGRGNKVYSLEGVDYKIIDNPTDAPIGISHLDAAQCTRTGDPEYPVIYVDRFGAVHKLAWYQVVTLQDMPSAQMDKNGVGFCGVSRVLKLAQTLRDMLTLKQEKVSGRFAGSIWLTNVSSEIIQDAVDAATEHATNRGLTRYMPPIIADTMEPTAIPQVAQIELASLPENFNEEEAMRWYIAGIALAFGVDYGFLAPLPGNKLGTSEQAEVAERQSRGKSSRLYMSQMEEKFNFTGLLPEDVTMQYGEVDSAEEMQRDTAMARRAMTRAQRINSQEITPEIARQIAVDEGDLDAAYLDMISEEDVTPGVNVDDRTSNMGFGREPKVTAMETGTPSDKKAFFAVGDKLKNIFKR